MFCKSGWIKLVRDFIGVLHYAGTCFYGGPCLSFILIGWLISRGHYSVLLAYTLWYIYDFQTPERGGRPSQIFSNTLVWRCLVDYFPLKLVKTADLPPDRNYMIVAHPHGLIGCGILPTFGSDGAGFTTIFPGLKPMIATMKIVFLIPFLREYVLLNNMVSVGSKSLQYLLTSRPCSGLAVCLVVGGTRELLEAYPGSTKTVLRNRKGFVKIALKTGTDMVPVYVFGENELYWQIHHVRGFHWVKNVWLKMIDIFGFPCPFPTTPIPKKIPLFTVIGKPIPVEKCENPTQGQIDSLHEIYVIELEKLFEENKLKYGYKATQKIELM